MRYAHENGIPFNYIGLLDADTCLTDAYFERLIAAFEKDPRLGISNGGIYYEKNGNLEWINDLEKDPVGTGRMWRKECFFETGWHRVESSPDSISNIKAILHGWKIQSYKEIIAIQKWPTSIFFQ